MQSVGILLYIIYFIHTINQTSVSSVFDKTKTVIQFSSSSTINLKKNLYFAFGAHSDYITLNYCVKIYTSQSGTTIYIIINYLVQ